MRSTWMGLSLLIGSLAGLAPGESLVEPGAAAVEVGSGYGFTEGPAANRAGEVYFTDIPNNTIHRWSPATGVTAWNTNSGGANGLYFDAAGRLLACEGERQRVVAYEADGATTVLAAEFGGKPFNQPNDLWVAPGGGIYFSDPNYAKRPNTQDKEGVYYRPPGGGAIVRVIDDFVKPNGLIGTPDGKTLYATDINGRRTWAYRIQPDGTLSDRRLLCERGSDGMALDERGNVYLTSGVVAVYAPDGKLVEEIRFPQAPANVTFGGADRRTLFVTARKSVYTLRMAVRGAPAVVEAGAP